VRRARQGVRTIAAMVLLAGLLAAGTIAAPAGADKGDPDAKRRKRSLEVEPVGTYAVGRVQEVFVDDNRPTNAGGSYAGAPDRTLVTTISYPAKGEYVEGETIDDARPATDGAPYPLIVFSHGVTANAAVYQAVINEWVSAGYVVAAPDYPLSNSSSPAEPIFTNGVADVGNQPADASFVIDEVLALDREPGPLDDLIARKRIGASGHSLGAMTTLGLVYADCCIDERVDAAAPMSGLAAVVDDPANYFADDVDTPLLAIHGDADNIVPVQGSLNAFEAASEPKFLVLFPGGDHVAPYVGAGGTTGDVLVGATTAFWDRYLKRDRDALDRLRAAVADPAVASLQEGTG
jgi:fermentation-respiration switch protein FrsA (DUF1100 family)